MAKNLFVFYIDRCDELVGAYVADSDPEARLQVGADVRKIQLCFHLLKVTCTTTSVWLLLCMYCSCVESYSK